MASKKKERNHYDLKEIENYYITETFLKRLARKNPSLYNVARGVNLSWLRRSPCNRRVLV